MKYIALAFLIAICSFKGKAIEAEQLDSLWSVWQDSTQPNSNRIKAYNKYIWEGFLFTNPDRAIVLANALQDYAEKHNYPRASTNGYRLQGIANDIKGDYQNALKYHEKRLVLLEELGDSVGIASCRHDIGTVYMKQGNYSLALENQEKSQAIYEEMGNRDGTASSFNNMGNIYYRLGNYPLALENQEKSLAIHEEVGNKGGCAGNLGNIGNIYNEQGNYRVALEYFKKSLAIKKEIGDKRGVASSLNNISGIYVSQKKYHDALEHLKLSLAIRDEMGDKSGTSIALNNSGKIYEELGDSALAFECYNKSLAIKEEIGDKRGVVSSLNNIGGLYQKHGKAQLALNFCQRGLALAEEIQILVEQKEACQCLYQTYKATNNWQKALIFFEKTRKLQDSLKANETDKQLQQFEFGRKILQDSIAGEKEKREIDLAHQAEINQKNKIQYAAIGGGALVLLLAIGLFSRLRYTNKTKKVIEAEKDRSDNLLLNILPAEVAEELKNKGESEAQHFDQVSILFTDFKSFTQTAEKLSAKDLVDEINTYFKAFDQICEKHGIEKIKTIGDAYMAAAGLGHSSEFQVSSFESTKKLVSAALEMQEFVKTRNSKPETANLEMRAGIHTGPVVAGIVGVKKFQYDIWGDTVNTAARMESHGEVGKVNVSQATYELLKDTSASLGIQNQFSFENRGKIEAKGKGEMEMYFVSVNS